MIRKEVNFLVEFRDILKCESILKKRCVFTDIRYNLYYFGRKNDSLRDCQILTEDDIKDLVGGSKDVHY